MNRQQRRAMAKKMHARHVTPFIDERPIRHGEALDFGDFRGYVPGQPGDTPFEAIEEHDKHE